MELISRRLKEMEISGMLVIGGFEVIVMGGVFGRYRSGIQAYLSLIQMHKAREIYPNLNIPMLCVPATISNNVPGTDFSLGADTSLNEITEVGGCDWMVIAVTVSPIGRSWIRSNRVPWALNAECSLWRPMVVIVVIWRR